MKMQYRLLISRQYKLFC